VPPRAPRRSPSAASSKTTRASSKKPVAATKRASRTQAERVALSHARLLDAGIQVIAEHGYHAASLQAIGERAGYSRGIVTERFGSKENLVRAVAARALESHRWHETGGEVGEAALQKAAREHRDLLLHEPQGMRALYMLLFEAQTELSHLHQDFKAYDRRVRARFEGWFREGVARGEIDPTIDPESAAVLFMAVLRGITMQWLTDAEAVPVERVYESFARLLSGWLTHEPKRKSTRKPSP